MRKKLNMTRRAVQARRRYRLRRKKKGRGGAIIGAAAFGPWGWLLPF